MGDVGDIPGEMVIFTDKHGDKVEKHRGKF
jgi:hypothetical protein